MCGLILSLLAYYVNGISRISFIIEGLLSILNRITNILTIGGSFDMAFIQCDFYSQVLGFGTTMNVILPGDSKTQQDQFQTGKKINYPTLYLLHGLSDDYSIWGRRSSIDRYVRDLNIAVVMPDAGRSFYTDMKHGYDYFKFISQELPAMAESFFPLSPKREDRFIAGLSMGGYGAVKTALTFPEHFAAAASLSGAVDIKSLSRKLIEEAYVKDLNEFYNIFGDLEDFCGGPNDLYSLAKECAHSVLKPKIFLACGTEDFLYEDNLCFKAHLESLPFDFTYKEGPGAHNWNYWDKEIQSIINWLSL